MSDPATDRILAKAAEETATRNALAAIADGRDTRAIAARAEAIATKAANDLRALQQRFDQHMIAFAGMAQANIALTGENDYLRDELARIREEASRGADD